MAPESQPRGPNPEDQPLRDLVRRTCRELRLGSCVLWLSRIQNQGVSKLKLPQQPGLWLPLPTRSPFPPILILFCCCSRALGFGHHGPLGCIFFLNYQLMASATALVYLHDLRDSPRSPRCFSEFSENPICPPQCCHRGLECVSLMSNGFAEIEGSLGPLNWP